MVQKHQALTCYSYANLPSRVIHLIRTINWTYQTCNQQGKYSVNQQEAPRIFQEDSCKCELPERPRVQNLIYKYHHHFQRERSDTEILLAATEQCHHPLHTAYTGSLIIHEVHLITFLLQEGTANESRISAIAPTFPRSAGKIDFSNLTGTIRIQLTRWFLPAKQQQPRVKLNLYKHADTHARQITNWNPSICPPWLNQPTLAFIQPMNSSPSEKTRQRSRASPENSTPRNQHKAPILLPFPHPAKLTNDNTGASP